MKIKKNNIRIFFISLFLCLGLFRICIFSNQTYRVYSFIVLSAIFTVVARNVKRIKRNRWAIIFGIVIAFSVIYQSLSTTSMFNACTYFLEFTVPFLCVDYLCVRFGTKSTLKGFMYASLLVCSVMDLSVLLGMDIDKTHYQNLITYLFGNKFMVAYLHMQTLGILAEYATLSRKLNNIKVYFALLSYAIYGMAICSYVNCATGIVGNLVVVTLLLLPISDTIKKTLSKPLTMMVVLLIANVLLIGSDVLLQIPFIQNLITGVLHKDLTLTGRFRIYAMLPDLFKNSFIIGYGYNSDIFAGLIGYGNAQNGILQYVLDCGIVGAITLIINWISSVICIKNKERFSWPMICVIYGFIICSLVEVCFKLNFILVLSIISGLRFIETKNFENGK